MAKLTHTDLPRIRQGQKLVCKTGLGDYHLHALVEAVSASGHSLQVKLLQVWNMGNALSRSAGDIIKASPCELERF